MLRMCFKLYELGTITILGKADAAFVVWCRAASVGEVLESTAKHAVSLPICLLTLVAAVEAVLANRACLAWLCADGAITDERRHLIVVRQVI